MKEFRCCIDLALEKLDIKLAVDCFHFRAPACMFAVKSSKSSFAFVILLSLSSFRIFSFSSSLGLQQQHHHAAPRYALIFGQQHEMKKAAKATTPMMQAVRIKNGIDLNGWKASAVSCALVGTMTS